MNRIPEHLHDAPPLCWSCERCGAPIAEPRPSNVATYCLRISRGSHEPMVPLQSMLGPRGRGLLLASIQHVMPLTKDGFERLVSTGVSPEMTCILCPYCGRVVDAFDFARHLSLALHADDEPLS
jgi:hypothetical protein